MQRLKSSKRLSLGRLRNCESASGLVDNSWLQERCKGGKQLAELILSQTHLMTNISASCWLSAIKWLNKAQQSYMNRQHKLLNHASWYHYYYYATIDDELLMMNFSHRPWNVQKYDAGKKTDQELAYQQYQQLSRTPDVQGNYSKAFYWLQCAAETGHPQAQYELGKRLSMSDESADTAVYWLQKAAAQGVGEAFAELEELDGRGHYNVVTRADRARLYTEAAPALQLASEAGDLAATVEYAVCCENGYGIKVDKVTACWLYIYQANLQNARAMGKLGDCYLNGIGVDRDSQLAAHFYCNAAKHGSRVESTKLFRCSDADLRYFKYGLTVFDYVKLYAELGDVLAQYYLGLRCLAGIGTERDEQRATKAFEQAAAQNNADAMCVLAELKAEVGDAEAATKLFCRAAALDSAIGQRRLADCCYDGIGVCYDQQRAVALYCKAVKQLDVPAIRRLGVCYLNGAGVGKDIDKAANLLVKAAAAGDAEAQVHFAALLMRDQKLGTGNPEAIAMLQSAADKGNQEAMRMLAGCYKSGTGVRKDAKRANEIWKRFDFAAMHKMHVQPGIKLLRRDDAKSEAEAFEHFRQAANAGSAEGCYQAALCYENGVGVRKDIAAAVQLYKQAADRNHHSAAAKLDQLCASTHAKPCSAESVFEDEVQHEPAQRYENETGAARRLRYAAELHAYLVNHSHAKALEKLVAMHYSGALGDPHSEAAIKTYLNGFEAGNAYAMCELARCCMEAKLSDAAARQIAGSKAFKTKLSEQAKQYALGFLEPDNDWEAFLVFKRVYDQNDPDVLCALGRAYEFGWGCGYSMAKAVECYGTAMLAGSYEATQRLRGCKGKDADGQLKAAFWHFKQLAADRSIGAQFAVGCCYYWGYGVEQNHVVAAQLLTQTASCGCANAMTLLGYLYESDDGVDEDKFKAFKLCKRAAELCHRESQYRLALCYYRGIGVDKDYERAAGWLYKAAKQGSQEAAYLLGDCHGSSDRDTKEAAYALQFYKQAAIAGHKSGQFEVGQCYHYGRSTPLNYRKAAYWYYKAADQGCDYVAERLAGCMKHVRSAPDRIENANGYWHAQADQARESANLQQELGIYLARLAANGCASAFVLLGDCYYNGIVVAKDISAAAESYNQVYQRHPALLGRQRTLDLAVLYADGFVEDMNEIDGFTLLQRANCMLRGEIDEVTLQTQ